MTLKDVLNSLTPISQGAEARIYQYHMHGPNDPPILLKHRFSKGYRHPSLDNTLTKGRITGEARMILKCLQNCVQVPGLRYLDTEDGILGLEWIDGKTVKSLLRDNGQPGNTTHPTKLVDYDWTVDDLMKEIGTQLATMHKADIIHGDLTTSNMMVRWSSSFDRTELLLIDFGLSYISNLVEDKAVDLYVLERAFASTHPNSEPLFKTVLEAYGSHSGKAREQVLKRLDQVRLRGRKRNMVG